MNNLINDFLTWRQRKRVRDEEKRRAKVIQRAKAKLQAEEEYQQSIRTEAYLLWEADGKPEGKDDHYWALAIDKIRGKNVPTIYKPYYWFEKRILEPSDAWIKRQAFISILSELAILAAIIAFIGGENTRRNNEVFSAWQTITSANKQSGSGGRIEALEFLNSRPWRFPYIVFTETWTGQTKEEWFWDQEDEKCERKQLFGRRWERQPLVGLLAPNHAYLAFIHLCGADLREADLSEANLLRANLRGAYLFRANLRGAYLVEVDLSGANLQGVSLGGADLRGADLIRADLRGGANLSGADLSSANLREASLGGASLGGTNLSSANLREADLRQVRNLTPEQVKSACYWEEALFDREFQELLNKEPDQEVDCSLWEIFK